ncbi:retrovirus-related pol polyprotein from transposon TNT 1-94 [Tanacetum coccineum]
MSNSNINLQTQSSNALHNAIMEAGNKDRPPIELIHYCLQNPPYTYQWAEKTVPVAEGSSETTTERIDNEYLLHSFDAVSNACEMYESHLKVETRNRGKAIVTSSAPTYDPEPDTVTEDEEMSKENEIDKLMSLISLSFKKIYKPTNNNLRTSSNTSTLVVQKSGIQCYNCKEYGYVSRECQKPKRVKDAAYHKEKMLLCKQEEARVQLNVEQADWKDDTDDESKDQELEAHYMYMA